MIVTATTQFEQKLWLEGKEYVCGIDEVGRGCFAGPVVVGAVIFAKDCFVPEGIADSKLLVPKKREELAIKIKDSALDFAIAEVSVSTINKVGIGKATQIAFRKVITLLKIAPDFVLIDAFYIKHFDKKKQQPIQGGDRLSASIAAASIIAKVYRDQRMQELDIKFPNFGFAKHKGYGTKEHQAAIKQNGLSKLHRTSFKLEQFL